MKELFSEVGVVQLEDFCFFSGLNMASDQILIFHLHLDFPKKKSPGSHFIISLPQNATKIEGFLVFWSVREVAHEMFEISHVCGKHTTYTPEN